MFFRLLMESFRRQRRRKMLAGVAILLGTTAVTAMLALATTIGDRIHKELAVYGANIVVYPKADLLDVKVGGVDVKPASGGVYLKESDLEKLKTIFWANNITGVSPELPLQLTATRQEDGRLFPARTVGYWFDHDFGTLKTGAQALHPWWRLQGTWPLVHSRDVVVGATLAKQMELKIGDSFRLQGMAGNAGQPISLTANIVGIVTTGDGTDSEILLSLQDAQLFAGANDAVRRVEVSARTKPEDAFARVDPDSLPPKQREIWYCRPYANSIAYQIREAIPGAQAEQVRRVEQSEGNVLKRISGLMWLISAAALLAAGFAVSAAMATAILERRGEIGLMRSLGASKGSIALLFYAEAGLLAVLAGTMGYLLGSGLAAWLGARIFAGDGGAAEAVLIPVLLPVVVALALVVAIAGSTPSIRAALRMEPSAILRADA
ncbi:ABC transporter permease [Tunturiibacter gelidoferens]|jgi:putative ABC transport system permease protein|uniref:ABC transport system permease protein n=1 Tax=Tunturiibacter gelidiferens TaxID=3069689 RepID=A0A9X0QDC6_9BACT|nr:ABC transporter permease [Edaphobacter lichenicola]MBB5328228.1 putative ABC transport system permease protein [Edaphobacter lichenicola]